VYDETMTLTKEEKEELRLATILLKALVKGPVYFFDLPILHIWHGDMYTAVKCLNRLGIKVERTDSGGKPTWEIISISNEWWALTS